MMTRSLFLLLLAPALLAPVRLQDSTPGFFQPPAQSPAPESYSLPAADPLITPTVIPVSPTLVQPTPTAVVTGTLNLPLPPSPTVVTPTVVYVPVPVKAPDSMSDMQAALCVRALDLVQELAMLSYNQKPNRSVMILSMAASTAVGEVQNLQWPVLAAFNNAAGGMPYFQPNKAELKDGITAVQSLCVNPNGGQKVSVPRPN